MISAALLDCAATATEPAGFSQGGDIEGDRDPIVFTDHDLGAGILDLVGDIVVGEPWVHRGNRSAEPPGGEQGHYQFHPVGQDDRDDIARTHARLVQDRGGSIDARPELHVRQGDGVVGHAVPLRVGGSSDVGQFGDVSHDSPSKKYVIWITYPKLELGDEASYGPPNQRCGNMLCHEHKRSRPTAHRGYCLRPWLSTTIR